MKSGTYMRPWDGKLTYADIPYPLDAHRLRGVEP